MKRASGILMPISALPSPYGIGTLGKQAREFVDFLTDARQSYWQMLPVGPTSYGDSPYQSPSTFAGNPYFIDLDLLCEDGLLKQDEIDALFWGNDPERVDYYALYKSRFTLLRKAYERGFERDRKKVEAFLEQNAYWLSDYSLFMAVKLHFGMRSWLEWEDEDIRLRKPAAVEEYRKKLEADINYVIYIQYLFFKQWDALRDYAHQKNIRIIGDMPIYVALDSVDVWSNPDCFKLDEKGFPTDVSGVPPDNFTADGQLWGNPLYDYERMEKDGYKWWINRVKGAAKLFDVIRIDHFRGFESYWAVPFGETTATNGRWIKGPEMKLVGRLKESFPEIRFIAEDLGYPSKEVVKLLKDSNFPGMKVLQFAFDTRDENNKNHLPHTYTENSVCYAGTHDNDTLLGWMDTANPEDIKRAVDYLGLNELEGRVRGVLRSGMATVSNLFVAQMQDWLELDTRARMNTPGSPEGNWQWRMKKDVLTPVLSAEIARMTIRYNRSNR